MFGILSGALFTATRTDRRSKPFVRPQAPWRRVLPRLIAFPDA
ncbi:hypothetical protein SAMN05444002_3175 [Vannielia litorea]|uniref:Uncharacterized protein n=1 Tax=Vannielia litorea TaxID=1217970 RepID=A0A1N6H8Y8_9RHOB|nr:hypothetical protein SAMN05444002_3175 [Vannielia litorea]